MGHMSKSKMPNRILITCEWNLSWAAANPPPASSGFQMKTAFPQGLCLQYSAWPSLVPSRWTHSAGFETCPHISQSPTPQPLEWMRHAKESDDNTAISLLRSPTFPVLWKSMRNMKFAFKLEVWQPCCVCEKENGASTMWTGGQGFYQVLFFFFFGFLFQYTRI